MPRLDARGCLGLLLVITGIRALGSPLHTVLQVARMEWDAEMMLLSALPLAMVVLEIAAGCAFAFRKPTAGWVALAGYLVVAVALLVFMMFDGLPGYLGTLGLAATVGETLGFPILLVVAFAIAKPPGSSARREVGVMLIVLAISSLLGTTLRLIEQVRIISQVAPSATSVLSQLAWLAAYAVVAVLALRAGVRLYRGTARRDLGVWVIAAIANEVLWLVVFAILATLEQSDSAGIMIAMHATSAFVAMALPVFLWGFVRSHPVTDDAHVPMLPAWNALLYVPFLLVRPIVVDELVETRYGHTLVGDAAIALLTAGFVGLAAATTAAAVLALRERMTTVAFAGIATALGVLLTSALVVITYREGVEPLHTGPFLQIAVTTAVIAWLHRTAKPSIPRAVVTR